ncbi:hypothetical protein [Janthinobacterium sp. RB2R34]|uniref:hypothetical protein n=1 Tax=Janthinobacterium sp. RB2R34 TaxID=3424193 RepID=UPI003F527092
MRAIVGRFATPVCPIMARRDNLQPSTKVDIFRWKTVPCGNFIQKMAGTAVFAFVASMLLKPCPC